MRRTHSVAVDVRTSDCPELTRRLHKGITDIAKRLDEQKNRALVVADLFTPAGESLRAKLKDYCERLILKDPAGHVGKTEELLWRKAFYDAVHAAKKLRKGNTWSDMEKALVVVHLAVGIGFYHHLILRLQMEYNLGLVGIIDFAYTQNETEPLHGKNRASQSHMQSEEVKKSTMRLIHRSLICLGDLARYKLELDPNWDPLIAKRYYKMAIAIDPNIGMPHNQLGTIAGNQNYGLNAVYHYLRCVLCSESFEGAEGNLKRAIVTHSNYTDEQCSPQQCVAKLLCLLQLWDFDMPNSDRINQECQDLLNNIEACLSMEPKSDHSIHIENDDSIEIYLQNCKNEQATYLTDDMVFKIVAICLMSIAKLKNKESSEVQGVIAITLAIFSQLVQFTITRLQESIIDVTLPITTTINISSCIVENGNSHKADTKDAQNNSNNGVKPKAINSSPADELTDSNDNKNAISDDKCNNENNKCVYWTPRKVRDKTKSLLTKLRRRKRRNSSDSDASDIDRATVVSSSDEVNSDISETEDDILSDGNVMSDDGMSDDATDEEGPNLQTKPNSKKNLMNETLNGRVNIIEGKVDIFDNTSISNAQNGEHVDVKGSDKDSVMNSGSAVTLTTNADSSSTYDESSGSVNTLAYVEQLKRENLKPDEILKIMEGKGILASIKICCDWLKSNHDIIRICANSSRILLKRITILLNLIDIDTNTLLKQWNEDMILTSSEKLDESVKVVPLPEDIDLKGLNLLEDAHKHLNWNILHKYRMNKQEETLLRILKLVEFGHYLCSVDDPAVKYDQTKKQFLIVDSVNCSGRNGERLGNKDLEVEHPRGKLMRHMGRLWLKAEVRALESRLRSRLMSPYLVPDHEALAKHTPALKRLVYAKKFIVVIPSVVVSALDEVKRISGRAREATRWLETQLRRGSRFLRAQRPHERLALPLIKGPRPKDKEAWHFFQIIECCHYLTQQTKVGIANEAEAPVVTLLTGCSLEEKRTLSFSPDGLAKSAGVNLEHIESFHTKWKASSKSHG